MFSSVVVTVGDFLGLDVTARSESRFVAASVLPTAGTPRAAEAMPPGASSEPDPKADSKSALTGLISESSSRVLVAVPTFWAEWAGDEKFAHPSSTLGLGLGLIPPEDFAGLSKGLSNGVTVEAAKGLESQGLPVSMATSPETEPDSMTSEPELLSL